MILGLLAVIASTVASASAIADGTITTAGNVAAIEVAKNLKVQNLYRVTKHIGLSQRPH